MKRVKISDLKAHLSEYLRDVGGGETIVVCDREQPIAQLTPTAERAQTLRLRPPKRRSDLRAIQGVKPNRKVDVVALLREDRARR